MYKKFDGLSKQAFLVAGLSVAELCIALIEGIFALVKYNSYDSAAIVAYYDSSDEIGEENPKMGGDGSLGSIIGVIVFSITGILFSIIMIFGIIKKNKNLIIPWIINALFSTLCFVGYFIFSNYMDSSEIDYSDKFQNFGYYILMLYTAVTLYLQMHREEGAKPSLPIPDETKSANIHPHPKYNPYFVEIIEKKEDSEVNLENKQ